MATSTVVSVGTTPIALCTGIGNFLIYTPVTVKVGGSSVNWTTGFPVPANQIFSSPIGLAISESLYGVVESGTYDVNILKTSLL